MKNIDKVMRFVNKVTEEYMTSPHAVLRMIEIEVESQKKRPCNSRLKEAEIESIALDLCASWLGWKRHPAITPDDLVTYRIARLFFTAIDKR